MSKRVLISVRIALVLAALFLLAMAQPAVSATEQPLCLTRIQLAPDVVTSFSIIRGPDNNIWVIEGWITANFTTGGWRLAKITSDFQVTEFPLPGGASGFDPIMTAGPDGNIWVTRPSMGALDRVTVAGSVTTLPLPVGSTSPYGIAAGPDGNLWVTETSHHQILKVGTDGTVLDHFSIPTTGTFPSRIIRGPDNNLWFLEDTLKIGRITTAGVLTEFSFPTAVLGLVAGPDGNIWYERFDSCPFPYGCTAFYGKITPSGTTTELGMFFEALSMVFGSDGNLWSSLPSRLYAIGRLTPTGIWDGFSSFVPPAASIDNGGDITSGADGRIWLSQGPEVGTVAFINPQHLDCYYGYLPSVNK